MWYRKYGKTYIAETDAFPATDEAPLPPHLALSLASSAPYISVRACLSTCVSSPSMRDRAAVSSALADSSCRLRTAIAPSSAEI